jgi:hypothetical protein
MVMLAFVCISYFAHFSRVFLSVKIHILVDISVNRTSLLEIWLRDL